MGGKKRGETLVGIYIKKECYASVLTSGLYIA